MVLAVSKVSLVIFDLDGTLVDSQQDLTSAVNFTRKYYGLEPLEVATVASYLGSGIPALVKSVLPNVDEKDIPNATVMFKEFYSKHLIDTTKTYSGVSEMLSSLKDVRKAILSNKSEKFSKDIIEKLGLKDFFDSIYGGDSFDEKKPSPRPIYEIMKSLSVKKENTIMVGDGANDIIAGKTADIKTIAVLYGYSSKEKVEKIQPDFIAATPKDVVNIIRGIK
ncbi:MAG: HAD-IA family hydrolase [Endomicrobiaceae bacterium]|nr:HAD-IA family hydrolase [Endomicrobiaceae bacterium]